MCSKSITTELNPNPGKGAKEREHGIDRREEEEEVQEGNTGGRFIRGQ